MEEIEEIIENPPDNDQYKAIKAGLIKRSKNTRGLRYQRGLPKKLVVQQTTRLSTTRVNPHNRKITVSDG